MWLLADGIYHKLQTAWREGREATHEQAVNIAAFAGWSASDVFAISGAQATIDVVGVLTSTPDPFAAVFGGANTTYEAIIEAVELAEADSSVEEIVFAIDSPGGEFKGMLDAMQVIREAQKPTRAEVKGTATSAAYGIAASADTIEALSKTASFGSVGVVADFRIDESRVSITNTGSPNKRPNPGTMQGQEIIRGELDEAFNLFAEGIAFKRGIPARAVAEQYGRGGTFFADQAFRMGMVDKLGFSADNTNINSAVKPAPRPYAKANNKPDEAETMDLNTMKEKHPELYAQIIEEGKAQATAAAPAPAAPAASAQSDDGDDPLEKERARVAAHMHMGKESGDMDTALEAIKNGDEMTPELTAKYVMAAAKKTAIAAKGGDNVDLDLDTDGEGDEEKDKQVAANIMANVSERLNLQ